MKNMNNCDYLLSDLTKLNGVGKKTMEILKKKKVNNIFDKLYSTYGYGYNWDGYHAYY